MNCRNTLANPPITDYYHRQPSAGNTCRLQAERSPAIIVENTAILVHGSTLMAYVLLALTIYIGVGILRVTLDFAQPRMNQPAYVRNRMWGFALLLVLFWPRFVWGYGLFARLPTEADLVTMEKIHAQETVDRLITERGGINGRDEDGETPLHTATLLEERFAVEILIQKGAAVDAISNGPFGRTPLLIAAGRGHVAPWGYWTLDWA